MEEFIDLNAGAGGAESDEDGADFETARTFPLMFEIEPLSAIELDRSQQWLINGLMPSSGLHVLYGAPGTGKSFVALHAALHVAAGRKWAGRKVNKAGVVYIASEGGRNFRKRVVAARQVLNIPEDTPFALITKAPCLGGPHKQTRELIEDIKLQCTKLKFQPRLIVLDTLSRSITDLRESDSQDIMDFVKQAQKIADEFDGLVLPVHHCGKDESRGMRGSSALHGAADAEWLVRKDRETGVCRIIVEKMKDGPEQGQVRYELKDVTLGTDVKQEPIVTCVAAVADEGDDIELPAEKAAKSRDRNQLNQVHYGLKMLVALEGRAPPASSAAPAHAKCVTISRAGGALITAGLIPSKPATARTAFKRAIDALVEMNAVGRDGEFIWIVGEPTAEGDGARKTGTSGGAGQVIVPSGSSE